MGTGTGTRSANPSSHKEEEDGQNYLHFQRTLSSTIRHTAIAGKPQGRSIWQHKKMFDVIVQKPNNDGKITSSPRTHNRHDVDTMTQGLRAFGTNGNDRLESDIFSSLSVGWKTRLWFLAKTGIFLSATTSRPALVPANFLFNSYSGLFLQE